MGKFTAIEIKRLVKPGRYGDGEGLWFQVRDADRRSWLFRFTLDGKARAMGLGEYPLVGLAEAREAADAARKLARQGIDPIDQRKAARDDARTAARKAAVAGNSFRETASLYIAAHEASWRNAKHRAQWRSTLDAYVYPAFGDKPVRAIDTADVMTVLEPLWHAKPETASRVRGRIELILDYAKARGWRDGDNPARWRGHVANLLPRRSKVRAVEHHAALPWGEIGGFMAALRAQQGIAAQALEFTILTAARTGEVLGARWSEIDLAAKVWTVPAGRMKAAKEHRVALSRPALAVLHAVAPLAAGPDGLAFPSPGLFSREASQKGQKPQKPPAEARPLSSMALAMLLRRMKRDDITVHGFRSAFRDWAGEATAHPREVIEHALAHRLKDKAEAAYQRGDLFAKRVLLMEDWGKFCAKPAEAGSVVQMAGRRRRA